jgi:glycosyltransferase involved in cell wall biosynthesis
MHQREPVRNDWRETLEREKRIMRQADGLVLINAALEQAAREDLGFAGPCIVEPSGFNPELFFPLPDAGDPRPGAEEPVTLVYVGNMHEGKGLPELIRAMGELPERFRLRIVGGGSEAALRELESLRAAVPGGRERIRFTGAVPQTGVRAACAGARIAVIPQQTGRTFLSPIKLYEYLALGLPVLCTPLEIFRDYRDLLHEAPDSGARGIAAAALELAQNPALAEGLRLRGLRAAAGHTWQARAERILAFADSL